VGQGSPNLGLAANRYPETLERSRATKTEFLANLGHRVSAICDAKIFHSNSQQPLFVDVESKSQFRFEVITGGYLRRTASAVLPPP
jgi:hypothetical protein